MAPKLVLYFGLYIYTFCLANQITGVEEDRVNKPDRAIPAGILTLEEAKLRWFLSMLLFPIIGWALGGWSLCRWALLWQVLIVAYNYGSLDKHWFSKNIVFITLGSVVQLAAAWQLTGPITHNAWVWIWTVALIFGVTLQLQDLRDVEGDRLLGRRTFPIVFGDINTRRFVAVSVLLSALVMLGVVLVNSSNSHLALAVGLLLGSLNVVVGIRVLNLRTKLDDHRTYMLHTYWFCAALGSATIFQR